MSLTSRSARGPTMTELARVSVASTYKGAAAPMAVGEIVRTMARVCAARLEIRMQGQTEEYIEFRSADTTMADRYGIVPRVPFEDGFDRLRQFVAEHSAAAVRG